MFIGLYYIVPFFSTITGNFEFLGGRTSYGSYNLQDFVVGIVASFLATLIIEFPFLAANVLTNVIMAIVYFLLYAEVDIGNKKA